MRKKRKSLQTPEVEHEIGKVMKTVTDQGERIAGVMGKMQEAQTKQMDIMNKFMGAMLEILNKDNDMNIGTLSGFDNNRTEQK